MTRRPAWLSAAALGGAVALLATSAAPVFAQGPGEMPAGGWTSYPVHGEVDCEAGEFNGVPYTGNLKSISANGDYEGTMRPVRPEAGGLAVDYFYDALALGPELLVVGERIVERTPRGP